MLFHTNLDKLFDDKIKILNNSEQAKAYIVSTFKKYQYSIDDLSKKSLTLEYAKAIDSGHFGLFQNIADWILFSKTFFPESLTNASDEYYISLGQTSYYKCYLLINKQWILFEELADRLPEITEKLK